MILTDRSHADTGRAPRPSQALRDFGRAAGGALVFALPMMMTVELWDLGASLERGRILVLFLGAIPLLVLLARKIGFSPSRGLADDLFETVFALGVAGAISAILLATFGVITTETPRQEVAGLIALQMIPGAFGALLALSQFRADRSERRDPAADEDSYASELFLMAVGALFLGFNIAPTDEVMLISFQMSAGQALVLVILSLVMMHGFVFAVGFSGGSVVGPDHRRGSAFIRFTLPGYVIALAISLFLLWAFARTEGVDPGAVVLSTVVLGFPAALGAAAARLVL